MVKVGHDRIFTALVNDVNKSYSRECMQASTSVCLFVLFGFYVAFNNLSTVATVSG